MERYEWKYNLEMNIKIMYFMGLWPPGDETYKLGAYSIYSAIMVTLFVVCYIVPQVVNIYFVRDDLAAVVGIIYITLIEYMALCKVYNVITKNKILKGRINFLRSDWFQPRNHSQKLIIEPSVRFWRNIYKVLLVTCLASNIFWSTFPLLDHSGAERRLPFFAWYPYDFRVSPYYEMTYLFQVVSCCYITLLHVNVDFLISGFNVYIGCQFDLLSDGLRSIGPPEARKSLIRCVVHHKHILNFIEECSKFSNWILFWHLIMSGVSIGITMFQLTLVVPLSNEFFSLLTFGLAITIEIFMYCWFGNEVQVKSNFLSYTAFESDWTELPTDAKKNLLFLIQNVTKPVTISTFNIFFVSLETFMRILKTGWSYFALLYQLGSRNG